MKRIIIPIASFIVIILFFFIFGVFNTKSNDKTKVVVAEVTHSVFYAPQYVALEKGFFEEEGLDVEIILTPGADNVMAAVLSGDANIGLSGSEATIYVFNSGEKDYVKTFAQLTQKDGSFLVSREKIDNFTLDDLKGKHVIGGRNGGMPAMTLEFILKEQGLNPKNDLNLDTSIDFANMAGAFIKGEGDFVTLFEPLATNVVKEGYGYKVAQLGTLTNEVPYTAYNARSSYIDNNKDIIKKFDKAINKALDFVNKNDSEEITNAIINQFPDSKFEEIKASIESYKQNNTWPQSTTFTKKSFDHLQNIVISAGFLDKKVEYSDLIYER